MAHTQKKKTKKRVVLSDKAEVREPEEWLYLHPERLEPEAVKAVLEQILPERIEYWAAVGVIEAELADGTSMDWEMLEEREIAECPFTAEQEIQTAFFVSIQENGYAEAETVMRRTAAALGGFFCANNETYTPRIPE